MAEAGFHHKSTFKVPHKPFKGKSKAKARRNKAEADGKPRAFIKAKSEKGSKQNRLNRNKQLQKQKRDETVAKKRLGSKRGAPKIVALIPLSPTADVRKAAQLLVGPDAPASRPSQNSLIHSLKHREGDKEHRFTVYETPREAIAVLDIAKVADIFVFVLGAHDAADEPAVDELALHLLSILKVQGVSSVVGVSQAGEDAVSAKKDAAYRKACSKFFQSNFEEEPKVLNLDSAKDAPAVLRWMSNLRVKGVRWREQRNYLLGEDFAFQSHANNQTGTLRITGYLRGERAMTAKQLVHLTGYGDFQLEQIDGYPDAKEDKRDRKASGDMDTKADAGTLGTLAVLQRSAPEERESLDGLIPIDELAHEQSIVTEEELRAADAERASKVRRKPAPGELSTFQSVWDELSDDEADGDASGDDDMGAGGGGAAAAVPKPKLGKVSAAAASSGFSMAAGSSFLTAGLGLSAGTGAAEAKGAGDMEDDDDDEAQGGRARASAAKAAGLRSLPGIGVRSRSNSVVSFGGDSMADGDASQDMEQKKQWKLSQDAEKDDQNFPDEVDIEEDTVARDRFARYRGLKSFKHAKWDPKESLPLEYSQIYQFQDFEATKRAALEQTMMGGVAIGGIAGEDAWPIVLQLANVPVEVAKRICLGKNPVLAWPLLQYERKVSVLHFSVRRHADAGASAGADGDEDEQPQQPIKGKEPMVIHCGFRRFEARPVYSQNNTNCDKQLVERYLQPGRWSVASCYARIMFPPAPVLMFRAHATGGDESKHGHGASEDSLGLSYGHTAAGPLVASGSLLSINPDRLLIKRAVLTGNPFSMHKRTAVVRFMFFNADDVRWFKPIELWTKMGMTGHIKEPRGTKGLMKCIFDNPLKGNDTVCMSLFKRQFPPFDSTKFDGLL